MSIEKVKFNYINQSQKPFTTFLNDVVQNLNDAFALGVYCYLSSLPDNWTVNKQQLMNHFGVGKDKIYSVLKCLKDHYLLEYKQIRNPNGTVDKWYIVIKDGTEFIEKFVNKQEPTETPHNRNNHLPEKPLSCKSDTYKENNKLTKKNEKKKEKKKICEKIISDIHVPDWIPKELWEEFKQYRKELKRPLSSIAEKKAITTLDKLREQGNNPIDVITNSIVNGWSGLFPIKSKYHKPTASKHSNNSNKLNSPQDCMNYMMNKIKGGSL